MATYTIKISRKPLIIGCDGAHITATDFTASKLPIKYRVCRSEYTEETAPWTELAPETVMDIKVPFNRCLIIWADEVFEGTVTVEKGYLANNELDADTNNDSGSSGSSSSGTALGAEEGIQIVEDSISLDIGSLPDLP